MKKTVLELATDIISSDLQSVGKFLKEDLKNTQPYMKMKVTTADSIAKYLSLTPEVKQQLQTDFGQDFTNYEMSMEQKIREYGNG